jgi:hypothetical protein
VREILTRLLSLTDGELVELKAHLAHLREAPDGPPAT